MRGKWVLGAAAILALVVLSGVGGRAFAGVMRWAGVTKNVTTFCVYVDREHGGASYGDVSVVPKYKHKVCIAGKRGPAGNKSVVPWNKTVATPGSPPAAGHDGATVHYVDLAKIGPFTVRGYCESGEGVEAITTVISGQDGSSFAWDENVHAGSFNSGNQQNASNPAFGNQQSPGYATEYTNGDFSVTTADGKTAFTGFATNGVYLDGANGPACSFQGYIVMNPAPSS